MYGDEGITSDLMHPDMPKIVQHGTWLIAACGEDRVCDVVQYVVKYPAVPNYLLDKDYDRWYSWVVTQVIPRIATAIEKTMPKAYKNSIGESELLLITHGRAFLIGETLGVTKASPYWSIGSGSHIAIGFLADKASAKTWPKTFTQHAKKSIEVAQKHDPYTRGKVTGYISNLDGSIEPVNG
jgi:hypothetical protein